MVSDPLKPYTDGDSLSTKAHISRSLLGPYSAAGTNVRKSVIVAMT